MIVVCSLGLALRLSMITFAPITNTLSCRHIEASFDEWASELRTLGVGVTRRATSGIGFRARQAQTAESVRLTSKESESLKGFWRSPVYRDVVYDTLKMSFEPKNSSVHPDFAVAYRRALGYVAKWFSSMDQLKPVAVRKASEQLPTTTSPGLPYTKFGLRSKTEARPYALTIHRKLVRKLCMGQEVHMPPAFIASRSQITEVSKHKARPVWVIPYNQLLFEGIFTVPLFEQIKKDPFFGWSYDWLSGGARRFSLMYRDNLSTLFGTDFSKFDQTIPAFLIRDTLSVIKSHFVLDHKEELIWNSMQEYLVNTPCVFFSKLARSNGSMPSGSAWTQILECIMDLVIFSTITIQRLDPYYTPRTLEQILRRSTFLGDDSVFDLHPYYQPVLGKTRKQTFCEDISTSFGLTVNLEKTWAYCEHGKIQFLGKIWNGCSFLHPTDAGIRALVYPEYEDQSPSDLMSRCIGVAYAACDNQELYAICERNFSFYQRQGYEPSPFKVDYRRFFAHEMFMDIPTLEFPTFSRIQALINKELSAIDISRINARRSI
uniref:Reverse transcriptase n=1 Tax=Atrato Partiti-like virus 6 TaxID=2689331 RepID=A0A6B9KLB8_9VIRU|nr:reverse transcriptase [Atrato Partiti-like virus 6]